MTIESWRQKFGVSPADVADLLTFVEDRVSTLRRYDLWHQVAELADRTRDAAGLGYLRLPCDMAAQLTGPDRSASPNRPHLLCLLP